MRHLPLIVGFVTGALWAVAVTCAQAPAPPSEQGHSKVPATSPATAPAIVPEAQALLDRISDAYAALSSLELSGTLSIEYDVAGSKDSHRSALSGSFLAPNRYRHELSDDSLVVSSGTKVFLYLHKLDRYAEADAPAARAPSAGLEEPILTVLQAQNPSLLLALCADAAAELTGEAVSVRRLEDIPLNGASHPVLHIQAEDRDIRVLIDPATHLIRQMNVDLSKSMAARGVPRVEAATITVDYTTIEPDADVAEGQFAWSPPQGATLVRHSVSPAGATAANEADPAALKGKPAADFTLRDLNDREVSLKSLRGSVVVLDFWATWCGPCREALPHLSELHRELSDAGVKVFAINLREDKATVQKFLESNNLKVPVLLDSAGKVAEQFAVSGIPQTVVIDKRGTVVDVLVGFGPNTPRQLRQAVQTAIGVP